MAVNKYCPVNELIELVQRRDIAINFGLAPNPFGFTFESTDKFIDEWIEEMLQEIECSAEKTQLLRQYIRGEK